MISVLSSPYQSYDLCPPRLQEGGSSNVGKTFSETSSEQKFPRPVLYIDQLLEKCWFPERYLSYPEEPLDPNKVLRQRINGCECFCKNNLREYAFSVANCIIKNYTDPLIKEQVCEKLRPLFLQYPVSIEVADFLASTMPASLYAPLIRCHAAIQEKDWQEVSKLLPALPDPWKRDFLPQFIREEKFDLLLEVARGSSIAERDQICDKLITINTLESLKAAEEMASPSYLLVIQCWIAIKENLFNQVKELLILLPDNLQKQDLIKALSAAEDLSNVQTALKKPSYNNSKFYKTFFSAVCVCLLASIGAFFYKRQPS